MLKQEEALAELDVSIDDWVNKLEQAENRRTRVRQKLLEHVAAAATLPGAGAAAASESLQLAMGIRPPPPIGVGNISTPPRSPTKTVFAPHTVANSPSPQRVVAQVPSTILELPLVEEAAAIGAESLVAAIRRADVESIRVYADSDVYALLADVENQITQMSSAIEVTTPMSEDERKQLYRARSHELLNGLTAKSSNGSMNSVPGSPPAPSPPMKNSPVMNSEAVFLTSAVFRPEKSVTAN
jgi:Up-regulated During Septation